MEAAVSTDMGRNSGRPERPTMMIGIDWVPDVAHRNNRKKNSRGMLKQRGKDKKASTVEQISENF